jgi:cytochrome c5
MGEHEDKVFFKRFGGVMLGLLVITITIIIVADQYEKSDPTANPSRQILAAERVVPVGDVRTEMPAEEATPPAPATSEPALAAESAPAIDGSAVYGAVCMACHMTGAAGAPVPGSDAWAERVAKGLDTLAASAINGIGIMPAKGGRPDLSDAEIKAAVEHMLGM